MARSSEQGVGSRAEMHDTRRKQQALQWREDGMTKTLGALLALGLMGTIPAAAQSYPSKTITSWCRHRRAA
jgi:hypothetical protein